MLYDSFGRIHNYLRISVTDACNLRCLYCMPDKIRFAKKDKLLTPREISMLASLFVSMGITKIRITGGEPLVRKDICEIMERLSGLDAELTITTNALLAGNFIDAFKQNGIRSVNVSLDSLDPEIFFRMTKRDEFSKIQSNILLLLKNGFKVKVNIVVIRNMNVNSITDFIEWTKDHDLEVRFIEFMPFSGNHWDQNSVFSYDKIIELITSKFTIHKLPDHLNDTSRKYRADGHKGTFGIISTITKPFCEGCNRLRLTYDGKLKNCLFSKNETDLITSFRKGEDITSLIQNCLINKQEERGGQFDNKEIINRSMISIGG